MKFLIPIFIFNALLANVFAADLNLDPSELSLKVYEVWLSTSAKCEKDKATQLHLDENPSYRDFLDSPVIGAGELADGTYKCVILVVSDFIKFKVAANSTSGGCVAGTEYTLDVCRSGNNDSTIDLDGVDIPCGAAADDKVYLYLSTAVGGNSNQNAFHPPTVETGETTNGLQLASSLTVSAATSAKFVVDGTGKVCDTNDAACNGNGTCELDAPLFKFEKL